MKTEPVNFLCNDYNCGNYGFQNLQKTPVSDNSDIGLTNDGFSVIRMLTVC